MSNREIAVRGAAAKRAAADLSNYDSVFSSGIDEYSKISHAIDEQSRKVIDTHTEGGRDRERERVCAREVMCVNNVAPGGDFEG